MFQKLDSKYKIFHFRNFVKKNSLYFWPRSWAVLGTAFLANLLFLSWVFLYFWISDMRYDFLYDAIIFCIRYTILSILVCSCLFCSFLSVLFIPVCSCLFLSVLVCFCLFLSVPVCSRLFLYAWISHKILIYLPLNFIS